ncbi:MAG: hypothetical protein ACK4NE_10445 [Albidovulum sp.]
MRESVSLAAMFPLLAFAGLEPGHARAAKTCQAGAVAMFLSTGC